MSGTAAGPDLSMFAQLAAGIPLPSPQDLMGRILVKNKKRHRPSMGMPDSSVRKRPLEQSNSALSESSAATEPSSPQLGKAWLTLSLDPDPGSPPGTTPPQPRPEPVLSQVSLLQTTRPLSWARDLSHQTKLCPDGIWLLSLASHPTQPSVKLG